MASTMSTSAAATPLAALLALFLRKSVPESAEPPYLGTVAAVAALEDGPDDIDVKRDGAQLMAAIAQSRRFRMQLVERGAVELVCEQLSATSDKHTRLYAMQTLAHLGLDPKAHRRLHSSGAVDALLAHLARPVCGHEESEEALRALHCLLTSPAIRERLVDLDGIACMVDLVVAGSALQKERAAFVLWMLAAIPAIQPTFVATKAIPALVHALQDADSSDLTDVALSALTLLAEDAGCRNALLAERVLELLPRVLQSDARDAVAYRTELLEEMLTARPQRV